MDHIPPDIYERVRGLAVGIVDASAADDSALTAALTGTLRVYYEEQASAGRFHPFLTEAMADYTEDDADAVRLYELALEQAKAFPGEPRHTKLISLGDRLAHLGRNEVASKTRRKNRAPHA